MNGTIGDGETEPGTAGLAFPGATHAIKRFEDLRQFSRRNPWTLVDYVNDREILFCSVVQLQADFYRRPLLRIPSRVTDDILNRAAQQSHRTDNQTRIGIRR